MSIPRYRGDGSDSMFSTGSKTYNRLKSKYKATKENNPYLSKEQVKFYKKIDNKEA